MNRRGDDYTKNKHNFSRFELSQISCHSPSHQLLIYSMFYAISKYDDSILECNSRKTRNQLVRDELATAIAAHEARRRIVYGDYSPVQRNPWGVRSFYSVDSLMR